MNLQESPFFTEEEMQRFRKEWTEMKKLYDNIKWVKKDNRFFHLKSVKHK